MAFSKNRSSRKSSLSSVLMLVGAMFFGIGLVISGFYFKELWSWWSVQSWMEVPCWIDRAELKTHQRSRSRNRGTRTTYKVEVTYHYEYQGNSYQGDKLTYSLGNDNIGSFQKIAAAELKSYVQNREPFRGYVNPQHPEQAVLYRHLRLGGFMILLVFPLGFCAIGGFAFYEAWGGRINSRVRKSHPDEPWRWKQEWAGECLKAPNPFKALTLYIAWSGLLIMPLIVASFVSGAFFGSSGPLIWIVVILWSIPIGLAIRYLRQQLIVGDIRFKPEDWPISQAAGLQGQLMFSRPVTLRNPLEITVSCVKRFTRRPAKKTMAQTELLWSATEIIDARSAICDLSGTRVPISMALPYDAPDTTVEISEIDYVWNLKVHSKDEGVSVDFDLPVFNTMITKDANPVIEEVGGAVSLLQAAEDNLEQELTAAGLQVLFSPDNMPQRIACPPGRYRKLTDIFVILNVCWTVYFFYLLVSDAPRVLSVLWVISSVTFWSVILYMILIRRSATFTNEGVEIESGLKGAWRRRKFYPRNTLLKFTCTANRNRGDISYFDVNFTHVNGRKGKIADMIPSLAMGEALVQRLENWRTNA